MASIADLAKKGVNFNGYYGEEKKPSDDGDFMRGLKSAAYQIPETIGGSIALVGDATGIDGLRDYGMKIYEANHARDAALSKENDSFTHVAENAGEGLHEFVAHGAGYVGGQALTALVTGGAGGFIGSQIAKQGIKRVVARGVESAIARDVAAKVAARGMKIGAGGALFGSNLSQEAGSIYPEAVQQAASEGRTLDGWDKARIGGAALAAAGVETLADSVMIGKAMHGGRRAVLDPATGTMVNESLFKAARREIPVAMAREAGTEGVQTGIERYGAGQNMTSADAIRDYVDSMALGGLGGGLGGSVGALHAQKVPDTGMLSRAANASLDEKILQLQNDPDPLISFPDGSVGHKADFEAYIAGLPPEEQLPTRRRMMGRDEASGKRVEPEPAPEPKMTSQEASTANLKAWSARHDGVDLEQAQNLLAAPGAKGLDLMIAPHASGKGFTVVPSRWLSLEDQAKAVALQKGDAAKLPGPDRTAPNGNIIVDGEGGASKETYGDQTRAAQGYKRIEEAKRRREELGTSVPHGTKGTAKENVSDAANDLSGNTGTAGADAAAKGNQQNRTQKVAPESVDTAGVRGPRSQGNPNANAGQDAALILNNKGEPFKVKVAAINRAKALGQDVHEVVDVAGGFAVRKKTALDDAAHAAATSPHNDLPEPTQAQKEAGNYQKGHAELHGFNLAIENPRGSTRSGVDRSGKPWSNKLKHHYGYIKGTIGADKDHIDAFVGHQPASTKVYVVDQTHPDTGKFDEHKVIFGAESLDDAKETYAVNYAKGWKGGKTITETNVTGLKTWLKDGDTKKPFAGQQPVSVSSAIAPEAAPAVAPAARAEKSAKNIPENIPVKPASPSNGDADANSPQNQAQQPVQPSTVGANEGKEQAPESPPVQNEAGAAVGGHKQGAVRPEGKKEAKTAAASVVDEKVAELRNRATAVYQDHLDRMGPESADEPKDVALRREQLTEQVKNPNRYHEVTEEENPKGLKVGDRANNGKYNGTVVGIKTRQKNGEPHQEVHIQADNTYGGWSPIDDVNPGEMSKTAKSRPQTIDEAKAAVRAYFDWYMKENPGAHRPMPGIHGGNTFTLDSSGAPFTKDGEVMVNGMKEFKFKYADIWAAAKPAEATKSTKPKVMQAKKEAAAAPEAAESKSIEAVQPIVDFGQKLEGARKDKTYSLDKELTDEALATEPLSKVWPADEWQSFDDDFTAAVAHTARAEVPAKPRTSYKVARWVEKVKVVRSLARMVADGTVTQEKLEGELSKVRALDGFAAKVRLLQTLPREQWKRIGEVREYPDAYRYDKSGEKVASPHSSVQIDGKSNRFDTSSIMEASDRINELLGTEAQAKKMQFEVRGRPGAYFINKKGDKEYRHLKEFTDSKEALAYRDSNYDDLLAAWEGVKDRDNVKETDVRNAENRPRTGADHRNGKDVTAEQFQDAFGFRGGQFGNWVAQGTGAKERQSMLNQAYDALMDLSDIVGVPPKAISLNGTLGISFGARGSGWASAHFEPSNLVINLTKTRGAGALAHEWFHALDNYFSRQRGGEVKFTGDQAAYRKSNYITYKPEPVMVHKSGRAHLTTAKLEAARAQNPGSAFYKAENWALDPTHPEGVRPEVERAFADLVTALNESPMAARAKSIDKTVDGYWSRIIEMGARSFENFIISKMMEKGYHNDYLANVTPATEFPRSKSRYPYLLPEEVAPVAKAFDDLFATLQTKESDAGDVLLFNKMDQTKPGDNVPASKESLAKTSEEPNINEAPSFAGDDLDEAARVFLSAFPEGTIRYNRTSATAGKAKAASLLAAHDIAGDPTAERTTGEQIGPFSGFTSRGRVTTNFYGQPRLSISVFGNEQLEAGLTDKPALEIEVEENGDFSIYAVPSDTQTYKEFVKRGWAEPATGRDKAIQYFADEDGEFWTRLTGSTPSQVIDLLGDVHARVLAWKGEEHTGMSWNRLTGATGGGLDGRKSAIYFNQHQVADNITEADRNLVSAIEKGATAADLLGTIAKQSDNPQYREIAQALAKLNLASSVEMGTLGNQQFAVQNRENRVFTAGYSPKRDKVILFSGTNAERNLIHEFTHAATFKALRKNGLASRQMKALFEHVKQSGELDGMYGMENVDEFVAEVFSNPEFQTKLEAMTAMPAGSKFKNAWQKFVSIVLRALGLEPGAVNALEQAMRMGTELMAENSGDVDAGTMGNLDTHIKVDGVKRPTTNAEGRPIAATKEALRNFWRWFGDSVVVSADGHPLPVFHGTDAKFDAFKAGEIYFATDRDIAEDHGDRIIKAYLSIKKPLTFDYDHFPGLTTEQIKEQGYDGIVVENYDTGDEIRDNQVQPVYVAFEPTQVKSANKNNGKFDPEDESLLGNVAGGVDSLLGKLGVQQTIRNNVSDLFQSEKTFNGWWHKSIGTQYHKAQVDPHYRRVYNAVQDYLSTVSAMANDAADLAPGLLPKLEGLSDLTKKSAAKEDTAAVGNAVFTGTLTDAKVYSDAELRSKFKLNDKQIGLYKEFRATTDRSLDDMAKTTMIRYAGDIGRAVKDSVMGAKDARAGAEMLAAQLEQKGQEEDAATIRMMADKVSKLKSEGYAPLMRFGEHTVYVTDAKGNQLFFGMAETGREAEAMARDMRETYPDATVTKGILSKEGAKLFSGISPDTIELFSQITGMDKDPLFQDYLKLVVNNRSALTRLIHRKGVAGFSQDTTRVLASFVTSNARASSKNLHGGEMQSAANDVPKEKGDVRDEAIKLVDYIQNPVEEATKIRGLLFTNFIGGSIASAAVNMTQPVMMTLPYLAQFGGAAKATAGLFSAMKMAATVRTDNIADPALRAALQRGESEGQVSPQEIHNLQAEAQRSSKGFMIGDKEIVSSIAMRKMALVWGGLFGLAEQFNRRSTFIAAFETAKGMSKAELAKAGVAGPYEFAVKAIAETQGVYNRGNRPDWARGALGATLMTFKQYSIAYIEFLKRLPPKERALALGILAVAAGANGLPFSDDIDDIIDTIGQALGYNMNIKKSKARFLTKTFGQGASDFLLHGFTGVGGLPLDVSMRMGMGNLLPATGLLMQSETHKDTQYAEILGAAGAYGKKLVDAGGKALAGDAKGALEAVSATAVANVMKAVDMMQTGAYRDQKGRKVINTDATDAITKAIGFQPSSVAREQKELSLVRQDIDMANTVKARISDKWAQGVFEQDPEAARKARADINAWNEKNPESRINVNAFDVAKKVREMRMAKSDRVIKHAPKAMRAAVREELK